MDCSEIFQEYAFLDEHIKSHAYGKEQEITQVIGVKESSQLPNVEDTQLKVIQNETDANQMGDRGQSQSIQEYMATTSSRFQCTYSNCGKSFSRKSRLKAHLHLHLGTQPFRCPYQGCAKAFSERPNLIIHTRIHTKEKPFTCTMCGKQFTTKGNMKDHERRHFKQKYTILFTYNILLGPTLAKIAVSLFIGKIFSASMFRNVEWNLAEAH